MKVFFLVFLFALISPSIHSQDWSRFVFIDGCSQQIIEPKFEVCSEAIFLLRISYTMESENSISQGSSIVDIRKPITDTITTSRIVFSVDKRSKQWAFLNCKEPCEGTATTYFPNGNKRFEGVFSNGKPLEVSYYSYNGIIETRKYIIPGTLKSSRINHFDEHGIIREYEIFVHKKHKTVVKTFNKEGKRIGRKVHKGTDLINFESSLSNKVHVPLGVHQNLKYLR